MNETLQVVIAADGAAVSYQQFGRGSRLITCLHSLALDGSWYALLAEALGPDYRLLAPDFRGHGLTPRADSEISLGLIADDVRWIWDAEGISSSVVLGISLGGMVAQAITGNFPDRVEAQILMTTRGAYDQAAVASTRARAAELQAPHGLQDSEETTMYRWFGDASRDAAHHPLVERAREQYLGADGATIGAYVNAMTRVGDFRCDRPPPTLVVGGDDDRSTPRATIEQLAASIPGAELRFARGGHLAAFDNPGEVANTVRPFLDGLDHWTR